MINHNRHYTSSIYLHAWCAGASTHCFCWTNLYHSTHATASLVLSTQRDADRHTASTGRQHHSNKLLKEARGMRQHCTRSASSSHAQLGVKASEQTHHMVMFVPFASA
jgi:hypothetical protein